MRVDVLGEPPERRIVGVRVASEVELERLAQRKSGAVGQEVAHGGAFCPAPANLRDIRRDRIVQRQPALLREARDDRGDHRLGQRRDAERRLGGDRVAARDIGDPVVDGGDRPIADDPQRCPRNRMSRGVLTKERRQIAFVHSVVRHHP
jgi:hypothetical protein